MTEEEMAVEVMKLNSGYDMPAVGLGTWQVCVMIFSSSLQ